MSSNDNVFMKILAKLLKFLLNMGAEGGQTPDEAKHSLTTGLDALGRRLLLAKMEAINDGSKVKANMIDSMMVSVKEVGKQLKNTPSTELANIDHEKLSEMIHAKLVERHASEDYKSEFSDFRNHDHSLIEKEAESVLALTSELTQGIDFGSHRNKVNGLLKHTCELTQEYYVSHPLTPRQESGLDPVNGPESNSNENSADKNHSSEIERGNDNSADPAPGMRP